MHRILANSPGPVLEEIAQSGALLQRLFAFFETRMNAFKPNINDGTRLPLLQALVCLSTLVICDVPRAFSMFAGRMLKPIIELARSKGQGNAEIRLAGTAFTLSGN